MNTYIYRVSTRYVLVGVLLQNCCLLNFKLYCLQLVILNDMTAKYFSCSLPPRGRGGGTEWRTLGGNTDIHICITACLTVNMPILISIYMYIYFYRKFVLYFEICILFFYGKLSDFPQCSMVAYSLDPELLIEGTRF